MLCWLVLAVGAFAQDPTPPPGQTITTGWPALPERNTLPKDKWFLRALSQESDGDIKRLHGHAELEDWSMLIRADDIEFNEETHEAHAKGNVYFHDFEQNHQLWCDHMEYNTDEKKGKFWDVRGESMPRVVVRKGVLTGNSAFHFEGQWAERIGEKFILYDGWVTNCKLPNPWWRMRGPKFDIIPHDRAIAYRSTFILRRIPLFYTPFFYHSLKKEPRKSGFLIPNLVPHSQRGPMVGLGYFWAINPSYDVTYRFQDYNTNAFGHHVDFRGQPAKGTDFDFILYGVQDRKGKPNTGDPPQKYSGVDIYFTGKADLGKGWIASGLVNYISTFRFRQNWTESFNEAIGSETHSTGFIDKSWSTYTFDVALARLENFQSTEISSLQPDGSTAYARNAVLIHKLPEAEFTSRDRRFLKNVPVWFSFESAAGLLYRSEPIFQGSTLVDRFETAQFTSRVNFAPHITTAVHLAGIDFIPSVGLQETFYGESQTADALGFNKVLGSDIVRSTRDFSLDIVFPSLSRVFEKKTIFGDKLKHVIEPRVTYRYETGVGTDFDRFIRFDETDLVSNTNELQLSLTNRIYAKRGDSVQEIFTWELLQKRYFDPTFGGALVPGQRNVFQSTADLTGYAFLVGPRSASPIVSLLRASPVNGLSFQWQADFDPRYHAIVDSSLSVNYNWKKYFVAIRNNEVHTVPVLSPFANQYGYRAGFGDPQHRGWNAAVDGAYDVRQSRFLYWTAQATYNTDCCGFSVQYRQINAGLPNVANVPIVTFAFSVANLGTFGTLKKQDRLF